MNTLKSILLGCLIVVGLVGMTWYVLPLFETKIEYVAPEIIEEVQVDPFEQAKAEAIEQAWLEREAGAKEKAQAEYNRIMEAEKVASDKEALEKLRAELLPEIEALEEKQGF